MSCKDEEGGLLPPKHEEGGLLPPKHEEGGLLPPKQPWGTTNAKYFLSASDL